MGLAFLLHGRLVLLLYAAAIILSGVLLSKLGFAITAIPLTAAVLYIAYTRSDGE